MARLIEYQRAERSFGLGNKPETDEEGQGDHFTTRLAKLMPAEAVTVWIAATNAIKIIQEKNEGIGPHVNTLSWILFAVVLVATPIYHYRVNGKGGFNQALACAFAFTVWVFSLGTPFNTLPWYGPELASLALPLATFLLPCIIGPAIRP
ncbi:hypothetical protein [Azospirillum soli]|uniref:hypothetical protein n=1 Tax=Azospirillum soli TaxID=1304799 RepID=UPI001AE858E7|nr:hypothetical protein [Azospirillum soli]MBP2312978.1 hypothetical protein [Azospirillum soli]